MVRANPKSMYSVIAKSHKAFSSQKCHAATCSCACDPTGAEMCAYMHKASSSYKYHAAT
jgi:hypothetical protein